MRITYKIIFVKAHLLFGFSLVASASPAPTLPLKDIKLPPGFEISVYATAPGARSLALGPNGIVFVGTGGMSARYNSVYALLPPKRKNLAKTITVVDGLNVPNGVAFYKGALYVGEINRVLRYDNIEQRLERAPKPVIVSDRFPSDKHHGWKYIAFGPDEKLYVPVGAPFNVPDTTSSDPNRNRVGESYAALFRMNADGSQFEKFASGIRNTVGFAWHPKSKELWFTDNGRDMLGDDIPADELNRAPKAGLHFGYPFCHQGDLADPNAKLAALGKCSDVTPPVQKLGAHVAALGMKFYTGSQFPVAYRNQVFIAEHGSWNRSTPDGYRVTLVKLNGNSAISYSNFATGWLRGSQAWGRPVDVLVVPDGSLLVSDDKAGVVYQIRYSTEQKNDRKANGLNN